MSTPITDAAWQDFVGNALAHQSLVQPMRRLELDRAALMEALENMVAMAGTNEQPIMAAIKDLTTARANFP